jgi:DNA-binding NtrC family response regulator
MQLNKASILVIDDDPDVLVAARLLLKNQARQVVTEKNPENLRSLLTQKSFDLILMDMNFNSTVNTGNEGLFWLKKIKTVLPDALVIMITAFGDVDLAVRSLKEGAADFMLKPWKNDQLIERIRDMLQRKSDATPSTHQPEGRIKGSSEEMQDIFRKIEKVAPSDANLLILGENGTGKDLLAEYIHSLSARRNKPFVKVDLGALTDSLFESELFGHIRGAFTDAREDRPGRLEAAHGGTLFLDEIGNTSLQQQAKLLTALQNRQITRLGSNQPIAIDVRLICATNLPLRELANEQRFRKDLIYRINTVDIMLPPLRQRGEDIVLLAQHFLELYAEKYFKQNLQWQRQALEKLRQYHFPGNIRELQYIVERAVIMSEGASIQASDVVFSPIESADLPAEKEDSTNLSDLERRTILQVLENHSGNISKAAKALGITRTALYRRLSKYDI